MAMIIKEIKDIRILKIRREKPFQFDTSGFAFVAALNIPNIFVTLDVSQVDVFGSACFTS